MLIFFNSFSVFFFYSSRFIPIRTIDFTPFVINYNFSKKRRTADSAIKTSKIDPGVDNEVWPFRRRWSGTREHERRKGTCRSLCFYPRGQTPFAPIVLVSVVGPLRRAENIDGLQGVSQGTEPSGEVKASHRQRRFTRIDDNRRAVAVNNIKSSTSLHSIGTSREIYGASGSLVLLPLTHRSFIILQSPFGLDLTKFFSYFFVLARIMVVHLIHVIIGLCFRCNLSTRTLE